MCASWRRTSQSVDKSEVDKSEDGHVGGGQDGVEQAAVQDEQRGAGGQVEALLRDDPQVRRLPQQLRLHSQVQTFPMIFRLRSSHF